MSIHDNRVKEVLRNIVHLSLKVTNSNLEGGGIRLSKDDYKPDIPYVCASTLINDGVELDYTKQIPRQKNINPSTLLKEIHEENCDSELIKCYEKYSKTHMESLPNDLSGKNIRIKQIILPDQFGYVTASPVNGLGLNKVMFECQENLKNEENLISLKTINIPFGGTKPGNVGRLATSPKTSSAVFCSAPNKNSLIQQAIKISKYEKVYVPNYLLSQLKKVIDTQRTNSESGDKYTSKKNKDEIFSELRKLVDRFLKNWDQKSDIVKQYLPKSVEIEYPLIKGGLLFSENRTKEWVKHISRKISKDIQNYKDQEGEKMSINESTRVWIESQVKNTLKG